MEFSLDVYSPAGTERIETKHQRLFEAWGHAANESGWKLAQAPVAPTEFRGGISASRTLSFQDHRIHGFISYVLRVRELELHSDSLHIKFIPSPDNYLPLIDDILPAIIQTVGMKKLTLGDSEFAVHDLLPDGTLFVGGRRTREVNIYPVFFMSEEIAVHEWGFGPPEMAERLKPVVEEVRLVAGGIYVIGSRQLLPFDQALALAKAMEAALKAKRTTPPRLSNLFGLLPKGWRPDRQA